MIRLPAYAALAWLGVAPALAQSLPGLGPTARRTEIDRSRMPWRALGRVQTEFAERCTGFALAPALVATAAHCLYLPKVARFIRPHEVHFLLGEHLDTFVDHARALSFAVPRGYDPTREAATARLDRAFLTLDHPVADEILHLATRLPPPGTRLMLGGYGQDRQERILADPACHLLAVSDGLIRHDCAATSGTSGAPLLAAIDGQWRVIGVQIEAELGGIGGVAVALAQP